MIFEDNEDYERLIEIITEYKAVCQYKIDAFCFMPNYIHLLIREGKVISIGKGYEGEYIHIGIGYSKSLIPVGFSESIGIVENCNSPEDYVGDFWDINAGCGVGGDYCWWSKGKRQTGSFQSYWN